MPSDECSMMVRAIRVQSQTGGNLAKVLEHLAHTIKERRRVYRKMRALTAEGRMSAWVIALLPVVVGLMIMAFNAPMRHALLSTGLGHVVMVFVALLEASGVAILMRLMKFEV
jgi:tight adherence protein B